MACASSAAHIGLIPAPTRKENVMTLKLSTAMRKDIAQPTSAKFEHRHFAEIARIIRTMPAITHADRAIMTHGFALELAKTNPKFDVTRFRCACIPTGE
jgi:hypothetical protein